MTEATGGDVTCVRPGETFTGRQDALSVPGTNSVFKTTDFINATVGANGGISVTTAASGTGTAGGGLVDIGLMGVQADRGGNLTGQAVDQAGTTFQDLLAAANAAAGSCGCPPN